MKIPFNKPYLTGKEIAYIKKAHTLGQLAGDGIFTEKCQNWIERNIGCKKCFLTHSGTAALEMMAILSGIGPGDEVIMPSFTFASCANAVVLRGATPVFVDIKEDTLNINENLIEKAITPRTRAILVVHYAGVGCEMDSIKEIARKHNLLLLEDTAQGLLSQYKGQYLGTFGEMAALSFHETKNVIAGEGGALLLNDRKIIDKAEVVWEKGTNRSKFFRGEVDKYSWVDIGSSYLPGEIVAAFLLAQLEEARKLTKKRIGLWNKYHNGLETLEKGGYIRRPIIPLEIKHNGHLYYILTNNPKTREKLIEFLRKKSILAVFHYVPLHSSPAGKRYGRTVGRLPVTESVSSRLLRLPLFYDLKRQEIEFVIESVQDFFRSKPK